VTYRLLDPCSEWPLVEPEFTSRGFPMPDPTFAMIMGAFDDTDTLQGFLVCQLQLHMEPIVLYTPTALRGLLHNMEDAIKSRVGHAVYFAFAQTELVQGVCERVLGMEKVDMTLYRKQL